MNLNKAFLLGNLTRDPEVRTLPSGGMVASFGIATNRYWRDKEGNRKDEVQFHNIVTFGKLAEIASKYLVKGGSVFIEGRIQNRTYDDKAGQKRYISEIVAESLQLGPKRTDGSSDSAGADFKPARASAPEPEMPVIAEDEETPKKSGKKPETTGKVKNDEECEIEEDIPF